MLFNQKTDSFAQLFPTTNFILKNEILLSEDYVPTEIVARVEETKLVAHNLSPITRLGDPVNMYIWGDTGVGKTAVTKYVTAVLIDGMLRQNMDILIDNINVNCKSAKNEGLVGVEILNQMTGNKTKQGHQLYYYLESLWSIIDERAKNHKFYALILFLDEIDALSEPNSILYLLSRARSMQKITAQNAVIEIILASNKRDFLSKLHDNVKSSANFRHCEFPDYNAGELFQILKSRKDAFVEGAFSYELMQYCAEKVADKYHGDARRVIDIVREAALTAIENGSKAITKADVDLAEKIVNDKNMSESLQNLSLHDKLLLLAIHVANKVAKQTNPKNIPQTGAVLEAYTQLCSLLNKDSNHANYMSSRIAALANKKYIHAEVGGGRGNTKDVYLLSEVENVIGSLFEPETIQLIDKNYSDLEAVVLTKLKRQKYKTNQGDQRVVDITKF